MVTKRVRRALMITALMVSATPIAEAQRVNLDALRVLAEGGGFDPRATAPPFESGGALEPAEEGQDRSPAGSVGIVAGHKAIVGSWLDTVTVTGGQTFKSLSTYADDGGCVFNDQGSVITEETFPHVFSAGHGVWVHRRGRTLQPDGAPVDLRLNGGLLFRNKIRSTLTLDESRDAYHAVWEAEFTDPDGNVSAFFEGTIEGRRIKVDPDGSRGREAGPRVSDRPPFPPSVLPGTVSVEPRGRSARNREQGACPARSDRHRAASRRLDPPTLR